MDVSQLSDDELRKLLGQQQPSPAMLSDDQLRAALASSRPQIDDPGALESAMIGAGKAATRLGQGVQQAYYWATGNDKAQADLKARVDEENRLYAPLKQMRPWATGIGEALPAMAIPLGAAASIPAALGKAAVTGALPGAIEYGTADERAKAAWQGAVGGALGGAAGIGLGRLINPVRGAGPEAISNITGAADKFNIPLTAGQATGSKPLQYVESALAQLPGSAGRMANVNAAQQQAINQATARVMGQDAATVTPEVVQQAMKGAGRAIEGNTARFDVPLSEQLVADLAAVESRYMKRLPSQQRPIVQTYIDEILAHDGKIPGDVYQGIRSDLGADAAGAAKGSLKNALGGIQGALDKAFKNAADAETNAALGAAREQYTNAKLLKRAATATGDVSRAVVANAGKGAKGDLGDLSALLGKIKPLPDSGTAQRSFWMNALTKNPLELLAPANLFAATGVPYLAATAVTRQPTKAYLTRGLFGVDPELEKQLIRYGGLLGYGASGGTQP